MSGIYEASIRVMRGELQDRKNRVERSLVALKSQDSYYADEHRKLIRIIDALLDTLHRETSIEDAR